MAWCHRSWSAPSALDTRHSTLGKSLDEEGVIHCSYANQVESTADLVDRGRRDVVLLVVDPSQVQAEIRTENLEGGTDLFPHIYGELPVEGLCAPIPFRAARTTDCSWRQRSLTLEPVPRPELDWCVRFRWRQPRNSEPVVEPVASWRIGNKLQPDGNVTIARSNHAAVAQW
jgi:uncharacterized protein (DUF952 family)